MSGRLWAVVKAEFNLSTINFLRTSTLCSVLFSLPGKFYWAHVNPSLSSFLYLLLRTGAEVYDHFITHVRSL